MSKESFRVIPSKIARFVDFLGADLPLKSITSAKWQKWTERLASQVKAKELAQKTAEVSYARARQFLRFMVEKKAMKSFPGLETSAAGALS